MQFLLQLLRRPLRISGLGFYVYGYNFIQWVCSYLDNYNTINNILNCKLYLDSLSIYSFSIKNKIFIMRNL